jgi:NADH-quinone oxidoreductase subunit E
MTDNNQATLLSATAREQIDRWLQRFPADRKRSGVLEALRIVQEENNDSLTTPLMDAVADYLGMPRIAVYEVATFYTLYNLEPVGKYQIDLCTNISCMLSDSQRIVDHLEKRLGIKMGETTPDGKFTIREVECLGACTNAPVCQIGKKYHEKLTPEKVDELLEKLG